MTDQELFIEEGKNTPKIIGHIKDCTLSIEGNSYPENVLQFYNPILEWLEKASIKSDSIKLECQFYYISSSSVIAFLKLMQKIESLFNNENIKFIWKYEEGDDDIRKIGQDYTTILKTPIDIVEIEES